MKIAYMETLLFTNFKQAESIMASIEPNLMPMLSLTVLFSLLYELATTRDFKSVLRHFIIVLLFIPFTSNYLNSCKELGFAFADKITQISDTNFKFINGFDERTVAKRKKLNEKNNETITDKIVNSIPNLLEDGILDLIHLLSVMLILINRYVYTIVFYVSLFTFPIALILSIIPFLRSLFATVLSGGIWLSLTPILMAMVMVILGALTSFSFNENNELINTYSNLVELLVSCVFLLASPAIAFYIISGKGVHGWASDLAMGHAKAASFGVPMALGKYVRSHTRSSLNYTNGLDRLKGFFSRGGNSNISNSLLTNAGFSAFRPKSGFSKTLDKIKGSSANKVIISNNSLSSNKNTSRSSLFSNGTSENVNLITSHRSNGKDIVIKDKAGKNSFIKEAINLTTNTPNPAKNLFKTNNLNGPSRSTGINRGALSNTNLYSSNDKSGAVSVNLKHSHFTKLKSSQDGKSEKNHRPTIRAPLKSKQTKLYD